MSALENNQLEQQIIAVARQLFVEKGFQETSMSDIAALAHTTRPTLHYYFRTKERMFQAVFGSIVEVLKPRFAEIMQGDIPFPERLERLVEEYLSLFRENPYLPLFICREINRDVHHLIEVARKIGLSDYALSIRRCLEREMEAGRIRRVPIPVVFMTAYSSLVFPFLARRMMEELFFEGRGEAFEACLREWKNYVLANLKALLCL